MGTTYLARVIPIPTYYLRLGEETMGGSHTGNDQLYARWKDSLWRRPFQGVLRIQHLRDNFPKFTSSGFTNFRFLCEVEKLVFLTRNSSRNSNKALRFVFCVEGRLYGAAGTPSAEDRGFVSSCVCSVCCVEPQQAQLLVRVVCTSGVLCLDQRHSNPKSTPSFH